MTKTNITGSDFRSLFPVFSAAISKNRMHAANIFSRKFLHECRRIFLPDPTCRDAPKSTQQRTNLDNPPVEVSR